MKNRAIILLAICSANLQAQLVINEGSNKNFNVILDEDDEPEDWIEIYNSGSYTINLDGYSLTDDETDQGILVEEVVNRAFDRQINLGVGNPSSGGYNITVRTALGPHTMRWIKL